MKGVEVVEARCLISGSNDGIAGIGLVWFCEAFCVELCMNNGS